MNSEVKKKEKKKTKTIKKDEKLSLKKDEEKPKQDQTVVPEKVETDTALSEKVEEEEEEEEEIQSPDFKSIGIKPWLIDQLTKLGIKIPTVIQEKCIPQTLSGKDVIGMSQTGTGKTASFALPIIQTLASDMYGIYALVLTPTRELADQIKKNFEILAGDVPLRVALIVGGLDFLKQSEILESKPHVIVGTPGRIEASMRLFQQYNYFKKIKYLVFDEDRILNSEFSFDIDSILQACNPKRQTLLYSATMNDKVKLLSSKAMKELDSVYIFDACNLYQTADNLEQYYLFMPKTVKDCYLYQLIKEGLEKQKHSLFMIFFSSIQECEIIMLICQQMGIKCDSLHAGKQQKDRLEVLKLFKKRKINCLFCTDVGNRGLDIPSINMVINYDLPDSTEKYVHRVGRTARAGQIGCAVSLISQFEIKKIKTIEKDIDLKMNKFEINEKLAESYLYEIAEKRCFAKIKLIEDGFAETYEVRKQYKEDTRELLSSTKLNYEKKYLESLQKKMKNNQSLPSTKPSIQKEKQDFDKVEKSVGGITLLSTKKKRKRE
eukprot:gene10799-3417_t